MTKNIIVAGTSYYASVVRSLIHAINYKNIEMFNEIRYRYVGCVGPDPIDGEMYLGEDEIIYRYPNTELAVAFGAPKLRRDVITNINAGGDVTHATLVHPTVCKGINSSIGAGSIVQAFVAITTNTRIGKYVVINQLSSLGHDVEIGDFSLIHHGAKICGNVTIGEGVTIGTGAIVLEGITIGYDAVVGAGAVVTESVMPGTTVVGMPAKGRG